MFLVAKVNNNKYPRVTIVYTELGLEGLQRDRMGFRVCFLSAPIGELMRQQGSL